MLSIWITTWHSLITRSVQTAASAQQSALLRLFCNLRKTVFKRASRRCENIVWSSFLFCFCKRSNDRAELWQPFPFSLMDDCHDRIYIKNYKNVKSGEFTHFLTKLYRENRKIKSRKIKGLRPLTVYIIWLKKHCL